MVVDRHFHWIQQVFANTHTPKRPQKIPKSEICPFRMQFLHLGKIPKTLPSFCWTLPWNYHNIVKNVADSLSRVSWRRETGGARRRFSSKLAGKLFSSLQTGWQAWLLWGQEEESGCHHISFGSQGALYVMAYYLYHFFSCWSFMPIYIDFLFYWQWYCHWLMFIGADWCWLLTMLWQCYDNIMTKLWQYYDNIGDILWASWGYLGDIIRLAVILRVQVFRGFMFCFLLTFVSRLYSFWEIWGKQMFQIGYNIY